MPGLMKLNLMNTLSHRYNLAPPILEVEANVRNIPGFLSPLYNIQSKTPPLIRINFELKRDWSTTPRESTHRFGSVRGEPLANSVHYEIRLCGPLRARLRLANLCEEPEIIVNSTYYRLVRMQLGGLKTPGDHLTSVTAVKLLQRGFTLVHGGALSLDDQGFLITAPGGTGKTLTCLRGVEEGFALLSEDVSITDGNLIYGLPLTESFAQSTTGFGSFLKHKRPPWRLSVYQRLYRWLPPLGLLFPTPKFNIKDLIPNVQIKTSSPLSAIFILEQGPSKVEHLSDKEALRRLFLINRTEFNYQDNKLLLGYSYLNPSLDLRALMELELEVLQKATVQAPCFLCQAPEPSQYIVQIRETMANLKT